MPNLPHIDLPPAQELSYNEKDDNYANKVEQLVAFLIVSEHFS